MRIASRGATITYMLFSSPTLVIRRARKSEAGELSQIVLRAKRHWGYPAAQIDAWRDELEITPAAIEHQPMFVGELDEHVIGFYSLTPEAGIWELDNLWIEPGQMMQGHGRALLAHALHTASDNGIAIVRVDADPNAESFYLACGGMCTGTVAAPIPGQPHRVRPQFLFACG